MGGNIYAKKKHNYKKKLCTERKFKQEFNKPFSLKVTQRCWIVFPSKIMLQDNYTNQTSTVHNQVSARNSFTIAKQFNKGCEKKNTNCHALM